MPGIRESVYIGGYTIARGPSAVTERRDYAKTEQRLRDGTLVSHYLQPQTGDPDLLVKSQWTVSWDNLCEADVAALTRIVAAPGAFDFCPWLAAVEQWTSVTGDTAYAGTTLRRFALDYVSPLPVNAATKYARAATLNGTTQTITLGTVADYRTPWTATGTPTAGDIISVLYYPIYRVKVTNEEPSYSLPHAQGWTLTLEEV